jgi:hypothetical protein
MSDKLYLQRMLMRQGKTKQNTTKVKETEKKGNRKGKKGKIKNKNIY